MELSKPVDTTTSLTAYAKSLRKQGYKKLGSGLYADVYSKRGCDHVIKLASVYDNPWSSDGYIAYLRLIDQINPMFPKISEVTRYNYKKSSSSKIISRYYIVKMERLIEFEDVEWKKCEKVFNRLGIESHYDFEEMSPKHMTDMKVKYAHKAREVLHKLWKRYRNDIHDGNVMWRKKKSGTLQLVIIDPATCKHW